MSTKAITGREGANPGCPSSRRLARRSRRTTVSLGDTTLVRKFQPRRWTCAELVREGMLSAALVLEMD